MGTASLTREQLNEAMEQFSNKIMELLGADALDEETGEPEITGTSFKAIDITGEECVVDATQFAVGTLIVDSPFEYFRCTASEWCPGPWIRYTGRSLSHADFAEEMRNCDTLPRIIHEG